MAGLRNAILTAATCCAIGPAGAAQASKSPFGIDQPGDRPAQVHLKKSAHKNTTASRPQSAAPDASGESERAAALARARKKFFENKPDQKQEDSGARASPVLGGSNGLTPGMQFKF